MEAYKIEKSNIAALLAAVRADARFTPALQKEIGVRCGRPAADGSYTVALIPVEGGAFHPAAPGGFYNARPWYDALIAAHGTLVEA